MNQKAYTLLLIVCLALVAASTADGADDLAQTYATQIQPLLVKTCGECHGKTPKDNDLDLTSFDSAEAIIA
jgi:cytochrome c553